MPLSGADPNVRSSFGATSVVYAVLANSPVMVQALLAAGGSARQPTIDGATPVILLARDSSTSSHAVQCLSCLLAHDDALPLDVTFSGRTAEQWARFKGGTDLAAALAAEVPDRASVVVFLAWLLRIGCVICV